MSYPVRAIFYAYILGGVSFVPLLLCALVAYTIYTSEPVSDDAKEKAPIPEELSEAASLDVHDLPKARKGWLTVRRTFEESTFDGGYVTLVRSFLDARSKDPKRSRPKDMWYVVLKGKILYLYEDEAMTECEAAIQLGSHSVVVYPEGLLDGELFTKRNAVCLKPRDNGKVMPSVTRDITDDEPKPAIVEKAKAAAREEALNVATPWFIFVRSTAEMEDWYLALVHASQHPAQTPALDPLQDVFNPADMNTLVSTLDEQPDIIPMRWFNAIFGRIFYSVYRTQHLESFIIGRLMKKLSKVKRPAFLNDIIVTEVSVGNRTPVFSKPMLKELTKEGDASMEVHLAYKGEVRITVQATATINLGARFKPYTVKLVLAAVLKELEGNLLVKVKRPPSNRFWYAFTQTPKMVLNVEPVVSDRQITWSMILSTIESSLKTIIQESVVMPNMDDIAFFESAAYENRGGIWADAARKHGFADTIVPGAEQAVGAGPIEESVSSDSQSDPVGPPPVQKAQSLQENPISSTPEPPSMAASTTLSEESASSTAAPTSPPNRRKTWFSSVRGADTNSLADNFPDHTLNPPEAETRGRTLDVDTTSDRSTTIRSQSTPKETGTLGVENDKTPGPSSLTAALSKQRSSSQSSSLRESDASSSSGSSRVQTTSDAPTTSSLPAPAPVSGTPPSPTNFLTTLKSRAADKQALSNSAKEAMRKWGVNWGGLKKDSGSNSNQNQAQSHNQMEDMPDHGSMEEGPAHAHTRSRTMSAMGVSQKARASYAEVRAAVAERKERQGSDATLEPSRRGQETARRGSTSSISSTSSAPIAIPANGEQGQIRSSSSNPTAGSVSATSSMAGPSSLSRSTSSSYPDAPDTNLAGSVSSSSSSSAKSTAPDGMKPTRSHTEPVDEMAGSSPAKPPIHVQPQPKTMSIPGIHASHRGEIMSMGSVAPSPQEDKQRQRTSSHGSATLGLGSLSAGSMGSLSKNPKIQSMYRLWKQASSSSHNGDAQSSNSSAAQEPTTSEGSSQEPTASRSSSSSSTTNTISSIDMPAQSTPSLPASMSSISKRQPAPPLPPRPSPVTISPSRPPPIPSRIPSSVSSGATPNQQQPFPLSSATATSSTAASSAQDFLKEIATKDDHTRKRASLSMSSGAGSISGSPPSPTFARRASAAATPKSPVSTPTKEGAPSGTPTPMVLEAESAPARSGDEKAAEVETPMPSSRSEVDASRAWGLDDDDFVGEGPTETDVQPPQVVVS